MLAIRDSDPASRPLTPWRPANDVERGMLDALREGDQRAYFQLVAGAPLLLPGVGAGDDARVVVWQCDELRYLLVVTSEDALTGLGLVEVDAYRPTSYAELAGTLAAPDWGLAISPHLPIGVWIPVPQVARAARGEYAVPVGPLDVFASPASPEADPAGPAAEDWAHPDGFIDPEILVNAPSRTALLGMVADLRRMVSTMPDFEREILDVTGTARSPDELIAAVVGPRGQLVELTIKPDAFRTADAETLARTLPGKILDTVRSAVAEAGARTQAVIDRHVPPDLNVARVGGVELRELYATHDADLPRPGRDA